MEYRIIFSSRRTVSLTVKDSALTVKAPYGTPRAKVEELIKKHSAWIQKQIIKQKTPRKKDISLTDTEIKELKKRARLVLSAKTEHFSKIMGLNYGRITITSAKTRFGSCSSKGNISYSYLLLLYPEEAIDYVVVHELAHLLELNHSQRFYKIVEKILPDYKRRAALLKL
ncbi:MAG: M48 family metallopeptidase [Clostridia bacterium]|nr:M48 family metallopeptidase [Clostridia bacterium]